MRASQAADAAIARGLGATQSAIQDALAGRSHTLQQSARILAQVPSYISRIDEDLRVENRDDLLDAADEFRAQSEAAWAIIADGSGVMSASTRDRNASGAPLGEGALVGEALSGTPTEGTWIEATEAGDSLFQAVAVPIKPPGGEVPVSGVLILGIPLDTTLAQRLKRQTNSEIVFISLDTLNQPALAVSTLPSDALAQAMVELQGATGLSDTASARLELHAGGLTWIGATGPLRSTAGTVLGVYAGLRAREAELAPFNGLQRSILFAFLGALAIALVISLILAGQITRPIRQLVGVTRDVAQGRYSGKIDIKSRDEIGELAEAFQKMLSELEEKRRLVEFLGGADAQTTPARPAASSTIVTAETMLTASRLRTGSLLAGRYEIKQQLGAGGMGVVYRAWDRELQEPVAIKTLKPELVGDSNLLERFKQEIRLARKISHPNVVRTHDLGEHEGTYFITMEFVEGTSLDELLKRRGALPLSVALTIGKQLLRALDVAHGQGVVHRDIKPPNLVVDAQGFLKVMDFGIARLVEGRGKGEALTAEGSIIGTPEYMAPEQLMGLPVDGRCDLYATGAVLFECVTGKRMVDGTSFATLLLKQVQEPAPDVRKLAPKIPESFAKAIMVAVEKKPEDRWQTAESFAEMLDRVKE